MRRAGDERAQSHAQPRVHALLLLRRQLGLLGLLALPDGTQEAPARLAGPEQLRFGCSKIKLPRAKRIGYPSRTREVVDVLLQRAPLVDTSDLRVREIIMALHNPRRPSCRGPAAVGQVAHRPDSVLALPTQRGAMALPDVGRHHPIEGEQAPPTILQIHFGCARSRRRAGAPCNCPSSWRCARASTRRRSTALSRRTWHC